MAFSLGNMALRDYIKQVAQFQEFLLSRLASVNVTLRESPLRHTEASKLLRRNMMDVQAWLADMSHGIEDLEDKMAAKLRDDIL